MNKGQKHLPKRPKLVLHKTRFIRTSDFKPKIKPRVEEEPSRWPVISALIGVPLFIGLTIVGLLSYTGKPTFPEFVENEPAKNPEKKIVETKPLVTETFTDSALTTDYGPAPTPAKSETIRAPGSSETTDDVPEENSP